MSERKRYVHSCHHCLFDPGFEFERQHRDDRVQRHLDTVCATLAPLLRGRRWGGRRRRRLIRGLNTHWVALLDRGGIWRRVTIAVGVVSRRAGSKQVFKKLKHYFRTIPKAFFRPRSRRFRLCWAQDLCQCLDFLSPSPNSATEHIPPLPHIMSAASTSIYVCPIHGLACPVGAWAFVLRRYKKSTTLALGVPTSHRNVPASKKSAPF